MGKSRLFFFWKLRTIKNVKGDFAIKLPLKGDVFGGVRKFPLQS